MQAGIVFVQKYLDLIQDKKTENAECSNHLQSLSASHRFYVVSCTLYHRDERGEIISFLLSVGWREEKAL